MGWKPRVALLAGGALLAAQAFAEVTVTDAWARATAPGKSTVEVFMKLRSSEDVALIGAATPAARIVEVQKPVVVGTERAMRSIDEVPLPAGRTVQLAPGGLQVMLLELVKPLREGEKVALTLAFARPDGGPRSKLGVTVVVRAADAVAPDATKGGSR